MGVPTTPSPPGLSGDERRLIDAQIGSLERANTLLEQGVEGNEQLRNLLGDLSGFYNTTTTPGEETLTDRIGIAPVKEFAQQGALDGDRLAKDYTLSDLRGFRSKAKGFNRSATEAATNILNVNPELANLSVGDFVSRAESDTEFAISAGVKQLTKGEDTTERTLNPEAVRDFKNRLQNTISRESELQDLGFETLKPLAETFKLSAQEQLDAFRQREQDLAPIRAAQDRIDLLQAQRTEKALRGELPVSEGTLQRKQDAFKRLKEAQSRLGNKIEGTSLDTATAIGTSAQQALGELKREFGLREDAERHGDLATGLNFSLQSRGLGLQEEGLQSDLQGALLSRGLTLASLPGQDRSLGFATGAPSSANFASPFLSLAQGFGAATSPFSNLRNLQFQTQLQNSLNQAQFQSDLFGLGGTLGGAYLLAG